jgi:hypothetical protein
LAGAGAGCAEALKANTAANANMAGAEVFIKGRS